MFKLNEMEWMNECVVCRHLPLALHKNTRLSTMNESNEVLNGLWLVNDRSIPSTKLNLSLVLVLLRSPMVKSSLKAVFKLLNSWNYDRWQCTMVFLLINTFVSSRKWRKYSRRKKCRLSSDNEHKCHIDLVIIALGLLATTRFMTRSFANITLKLENDFDTQYSPIGHFYE